MSRARAGPPGWHSATRGTRRGCIAFAALVTHLAIRHTAGAQAAHVAATDSLGLRAGRAGLLARVISIDVADEGIEGALRAVAAAGGVRLSYSLDLLPPGSRVSISYPRVSLGYAFREVLAGTDLDVVVSPSGYVIVVRAPGTRVAPAGGTSPDSGGGPSLTAPALRTAGRPQVMDRILVMGTPASGAPERSLASAVTVLTNAQMHRHGLTNMSQVFRSGIPGIVAWDLGISGPFAQLGSVRGSSSFSANYLKTYVDGVELASPYLLFALDPFSIDRIEVIRGPQGSALYGSDAISGVVQVVTRRGSPAANWRPQADVVASLGRMESQFADPAATQRHSAMAFTGGNATSLALGGTFEDVGAIVDGGSSGYRGLNGSARTLFGPLRIEGTMRYADVRFTAPANPIFRSLETASSVRPLLDRQRIEHETYGVTADYQPNGWWRQTLVLGIDRHAGAIPPQREPATVADALLGATRENVSKGSLRYSMALRAEPAPGTVLSATLGWERAALTRERLGVRSEVVGVGAGLAALYRDDVGNTGLFGQLRLELADALFVSAGLRGERNSSFGQDYGTAYAPMLGAAWTADVAGGRATVKVRGAYGKGIRPPQPSMRRSIQTVGFRQEANPDLEPEAQAGSEAGVEIHAGERFSVSLTAYNQNAEGLIQQVVANPHVNARTIQYQNVGRIHNTGLEIEGSGRLGWLRGDVAFSLTASRVKALSATYSGDLAVGDRVPEVPSASGLASVTADYARVRVTLGASHIGPWTGYDWAQYYAADAETSLRRPLLRNYWVKYPSLTKPFVGMSYALGRSAEGFLRVDNLSNLQRNERDNLQVTAGRTATVGLRLAR